MSEHDRNVSRLRRELRFFPVDNPAPRTLSPADIAAYNENGYLTGLTVLGEDETRDVRASFDRLLERVREHGGDGYAIDRYHDRVASIWDIATHPRILDFVGDIVGPDIVCWATHYFCKLPGDPKAVAWHQDCSYWALTPSKTVTAWLAVDDADADNGCMRVLPGSHRHGLLPWRETVEEDHNVLTQAVDDVGWLGAPVDVELRAGRMSLHSDLLVHGSAPNLSARRRCGLTLRYCPPDVRAFWGWNAISIVCRGRDASGHWASVPRPAGDDPA